MAILRIFTNNDLINIKLILISLVIILISGCADVKIVSVSGKVIDASTGEPLEDVFIYAEWRSYHYGFHHSWSDCEKVELTKTGRSGKYRFYGVNFTAGFLENMPSIDKGRFVVYKEGYKIKSIYDHRDEGSLRVEDIRNNVIKLVKDDSGRRNRIRYLNAVASNPRCLQSYKIKNKYKNIAKNFYGVIYSELHKYVYTEDDVRNAVLKYCYRLAKLEVDGPDGAAQILTVQQSDKIRRAAFDKYINKHLPTCKLGYLQEIRRKNIYSLLEDKSTRYTGAGVSACINKIRLLNDKTVMSVTGDGIFYLTSENLGDKELPVYLPLENVDLVIKEESRSAKPYLKCIGHASVSLSNRTLGMRNFFRNLAPEIERLDQECLRRTRELQLESFKEKEKNGFSDNFFKIHKEIEAIKKDLSLVAMSRYGQPYRSNFAVGEPIDVRFADIKVETNALNKPIRIEVTKHYSHSLRKGWQGKRVDRKAEFEQTMIPVKLYVDYNAPQVMSLWAKELKTCH